MLSNWTQRTAVALVVAALGGAARADLYRYADFVFDFSPGPETVAEENEISTNDPANALGRPALGHSEESPQNFDPNDGPTVVSLGQGGAITLGFDTPVANQKPSPANPYGYDLIGVGNSFQGSNVITVPTFEPGRFNEPGFIEVARDDGTGNPDTWYLVLPRLFAAQSGVHPGAKPADFPPDMLVKPTIEGATTTQSGDVGASGSVFDGYFDTVPFIGSAFENALNSGRLSDLVLDDPATFAMDDVTGGGGTGIGGSGIDLGRAVLQSAPGVPLLDDEGAPQFVDLDSIDYLRITDALEDDRTSAFGAITTEVDSVIVLPTLPEPTSGLLLGAGAAGLLRRRRRI